MDESNQDHDYNNIVIFNLLNLISTFAVGKYGKDNIKEHNIFTKNVLINLLGNTLLIISGDRPTAIENNSKVIIEEFKSWIKHARKINENVKKDMN